MAEKAISRSRLYRTLDSYIDESIFPCSSRDLCLHVEENWAPDCIINMLESLPAKYYLCIDELLDAIMADSQCTTKVLSECIPAWVI